MYTLYVHTFPNGKKYIGVTKTSLKHRFGCNGNGYRSKLMKEKILKYGWGNIKHKVLKENLTYEQAVKYERHYIEKYKTNDINFGYNKNKGGGFSKNPKSYIHINTPNRQIWYDNARGSKIDEEIKERIKESHLKRLDRYVCQYDGDKLIKKWNSLCEIMRVLGYDKTTIGKCCKYNETATNYKKAYKYIWKYEKKDTN